MARSGCQWRLLPSEYGSWRAVHKRFNEWSERGVWERLFKASQIEPDQDYVMVDSTIVRAVQLGMRRVVMRSRLWAEAKRALAPRYMLYVKALEIL